MPAADVSPVGKLETAGGPAKDASRISAMFDAIAARYDFLNHLLSAGLDNQWRKRAVDALQLTGTETVLDLCTGTGDLALAAMTHPRRPRRVVGVDFSPGMLNIAKAKVQRQLNAATGARGTIDIIRGDATRIPLGPGSVDAITVAFGIRNVEHPAIACREMFRVLGDGGRLVILEFSLPRTRVLRYLYLSYFRHVLPLIGRVVSRHPSAYSYLPQSVQVFPTAEEFARELRTAGFGNVRTVPLSFGIVYMFAAVKEGAADRMV